MIQSKYKFTSEIGAEASKVAFKTKSKKKEALIYIGVPVALVIMIGILIYDINKGNSIIFDVVLLALLVVLVALNLVMPFIISKTQKKYLSKIDETQFDYLISEYEKGKFKEKIYKDNKMLYCNEVAVDKIMSFKEFELKGNKYFLVLFNNYACIVFDLNNMTIGGRDDLLNLCLNTLAKLGKKKK